MRPQWTGILSKYWTRRHFCGKVIKSFLFKFYHISYKENLFVPIISRAFGYKSISEVVMVKMFSIVNELQLNYSNSSINSPKKIGICMVNTSLHIWVLNLLICVYWLLYMGHNVSLAREIYAWHLYVWMVIILWICNDSMKHHLCVNELSQPLVRIHFMCTIIIYILYFWRDSSNVCVMGKQMIFNTSNEISIACS